MNVVARVMETLGQALVAGAVVYCLLPFVIVIVMGLFLGGAKP